MSEEDYSAIELDDTTTPFVKSANTNSSRYSRRVKKFKTSDDEETDVESNSPLLRRVSSFQSALRPRFRRLRTSFRKLNCFKNKEEEVVPMKEMPRHKSIDIGVGLARRVSLFLFTRRTVCVHPYHPYTPEQTTRKLHFCFEDKYLEKKLSSEMPRPVAIAIGACLLLFVGQAAGKTFNECELMQVLLRKGFPQDQLKEWICIIEAESSKKTDVVGGPDADGSYDYGLFQINDRYWCSAGVKPGKGCNVRCSDLLSDDITIAARCALKIYRVQGYSAWVGWNECKERKLQELDC